MPKRSRLCVLLRRLPGVPEGIQPSRAGPRLLVRDAGVALQDPFEGEHRVAPDELGVPLHRVQVMEVGVALEARRGGGGGEALVGDDQPPFYAVLLDEVAVGRGVEHVPGEALGAYGLHPPDVEAIEDRYVPGALDPGLPREVGERVHPALVGLERPVDQQARVGAGRLGPPPHERYYPRIGLAEAEEEAGDRVPRKRRPGPDLGEEGGVVGLLQLAVLYPGVHHPEHGDAVGG